MKLKKGTPLIDQHDQSGFWGGKFGGSFIPETLKKPVEDLTEEFKKLRKDQKFIKKRDYYFKNYIGCPTSFVKLENLSKFSLALIATGKLLFEIFFIILEINVCLFIFTKALFS